MDTPTLAVIIGLAILLIGAPIVNRWQKAKEKDEQWKRDTKEYQSFYERGESPWIDKVD